MDMRDKFSESYQEKNNIDWKLLSIRGTTKVVSGTVFPS